METITVDRHWLDDTLAQFKKVMPTIHNHRYDSSTLSDEEYWEVVRSMDRAFANLANMKHEADRAKTKKSKFKFRKK